MHHTSHSSPLGLTAEEVLASRQRHGENRLTPPAKGSRWRMLLAKFQDPLILILLVALLLSFGVASYEYWVLGDPSLAHFLEPAGVLLAIVLATGVAFYFEVRSEQEFELLNQVNEAIYYKVYRSGQLGQVLKTELVVGDIVFLETGEEVPADGRLLESVSLQLNEASLTGEPEVSKSTDPADFDSEATYPTNYIYRGTTVLDGHALYCIEQVGDATEYGRVFEGVQLDTQAKTPLSLQLEKLAEQITRVSYAIALFVLVGSVLVYFLQGGFSPVSWPHALSYFLQKIMVAVTVIVVAVPEGLPMSVTLSLAYSMRSMMKTGTLVRRMHACETMGATTVICTDKTGTLTQSKMRVSTTSFDEQTPAEILHLSLAVNATAHLTTPDSSRDEVLGNPTEGALLLWLRDQGVAYVTLREQYPILEQLTFSTQRKYMATVVPYGQARLLLVKGAPEIVMQLTNLSEQEQQRYTRLLETYQGRAMRTIGFAYCLLDEGTVPLEEGRLALDDLTFLGVAGLSDPVRPEVPEAIRSCLQAGIQVKIITGDTSGTAKEIARELGLWDDATCGEEQLITGAEFAALTDEELAGRVGKLRIMSRARPMDKERLVRLLQAQGEVVAVTGDGTNDAPALKRAHVGLSMGDGTSVAKEASDITILDNSFATISQAVMWGRSLYLNIQRFILFQMTINVAACLLVLLGSFFGAESPLTVTQMLWVNLIMDTFAALALASLPPSKRVMAEKPRTVGASIISQTMARRILGLGGLFVLLLFVLLQYLRQVDLHHLQDFQWGSFLASWGGSSEGALNPYELTIFFAIFVFLQFWNMFNAKAYHAGGSALAGLGASRNFLFIALVIVAGQLLITTFGGEMFRVVPLDPLSWLIILSSTSVVLWWGELVRLLRSLRRA